MQRSAMHHDEGQSGEGFSGGVSLRAAKERSPGWADSPSRALAGYPFRLTRGNPTPMNFTQTDVLVLPC